MFKVVEFTPEPEVVRLQQTTSLSMLGRCVRRVKFMRVKRGQQEPAPSNFDIPSLQYVWTETIRQLPNLDEVWVDPSDEPQEQVFNAILPSLGAASTLFHLYTSHKIDSDVAWTNECDELQLPKLHTLAWRAQSRVDCPR